ncbi:carbohydrate-binding protein [Dactylosporangium sp. CA-233914]|uniref:carbohydrate-binding protein n=1 Tax=Dactylosporangium sp. CA-233914 TaxID=3239934 RepID=UPI003D8C5F2F
MRRISTVTSIALLSIIVGTAPATAAPAHRGETVTGTYSTGAAQAWRPLPTVRVGDNAATAADVTVVVDPSQERQRYAGIGFSLDETSVSNLWKLTPQQREDAVRLLVDPRTGAGLSRFRLTIGSPDLIEHLPFWSEDDLPAGVRDDFGLKYFSIQRDIDLHIVDTVKLIQKYNPKATFFASAWSAPAWMKTNNKFLGEVALKPGSTTEHYQVGKLRDDCVDVLARYYAKFVEAYARKGIRVDAVTLLNEPGMDVVYPAMDISVEQQQKVAVAMRHYLPRDVDVYVHDFNFWDWKDPSSTETKNYYRILNDPAASRAADAIAFHPYWGDPTVMRDAFEQYGKPVHMTETSDLSPATILSYLRLDASSYVMWAQTTDQDGGTLHWTPLRDNNVDWDQIAATTKWPDRLVKVDTTTRTYSVRNELFGMGQFARYLTPRHTRVESSATAGGVSNVVFRDGDDFVAVLGNANAAARKVRVLLAGKQFVETVPAGAYATLRWHADVPGSRGNHAPVLAKVPDVTAEQYTTTTFRLKASDRDRDALAFYAVDLPDGVTVDAATGVVSLHPTTAGTLNLKFRVTDGAASDGTTVRVSVAPHGAPIGEKVEAEAYVAEHGWTDGGANFVENNPSASGGKNVGWTAAGNWLQYRLDVAQPGPYDLELRVANGSGAAAPGAITFRDAGNQVRSTVSVPDTGGWANYQSVHTTVTLPAGDQLVTVYCETGGFNLDYFRLTT